jgi:signal transduction histidine kinase
MTIYVPTEGSDLLCASGRDRASEADADDLIRKMAHDLRQPIAAIQALAAAAAVDGPPRAPVLQRLRQISEQATWLATVINDLLADCGPQSGDPQELVNICALVRDVVLSERLTYQGQLNFDHSDAEDQCVIAPATSLRRAVANVVANAARAAGPAGAVQITEQAYDGIAVIEVVDNGPGLGQVPQVHGIGLQITRRVLAECGGRLEIARTAAGQTLVRLVLPAAAGYSWAGRG